MQETFQEALKSGVLSAVESFPKSDLHTHAGRSGNRQYVSDWIGKKIALPPVEFQSLDDMQGWFTNNIVNLITAETLGSVFSSGKGR